MLYKEEKKSEKIALKVKPGVKGLAIKLWAASYPFIDKLDIDALFEQMVTSEALKGNLVPFDDLPAPLQEELKKQQQESQVVATPKAVTHYPPQRATLEYDESVYEGIETPNKTESDTLEGISQSNAVELLR
jgi:hypothetical protein